MSILGFLKTIFNTTVSLTTGGNDVMCFGTPLNPMIIERKTKRTYGGHSTKRREIKVSAPDGRSINWHSIAQVARLYGVSSATIVTAIKQNRQFKTHEGLLKAEYL